MPHPHSSLSAAKMRTAGVDGITLSPSVDRTTWHQVAITSETGGGNRWRMYQNGGLIKEVTPALNFVVLATPSIGKSAGAYYFDNKLDEVRVANTALSSNWVWATWMNIQSNSTLAGSFNTYGAADLQDPHPPRISSSAATNVTQTSANLNGTLISTGTSVTAVWVYWGTVSGGTNASSWANTNSFGTTSATPPVDYSFHATNLTPGLLYLYRYNAQNASGAVWSAEQSFNTPGAPVVNNNAGATDVKTTTASLQGLVTAGYPAPTAYVCWGSVAGSADTSTWQHVVNAGLQSGSFSVPIGGLQAHSNYYYQCFVTNSNGSGWAASTSSFLTAIAPVVDTNFLLIGIGSTIQRWGVSGGGGANNIWAVSNTVVTIASGDLGGFAANIVSLNFNSSGSKLAVLSGGTTSRVLLYNYNSVAHTVTPAGTNGGALLAEYIGEAWGMTWSPDDKHLYCGMGGASVLRFDSVTGAKTTFATGMGRSAGVCFGPDITGDNLADLFAVDINNNRISAFDGTTGAAFNLSYFTHVNPSTIAYLSHAGSNWLYVASHSGAAKRYSSAGIADGTTASATDYPNKQMAGEGPTAGNNAGPIPGFYAVDGSARVVVFRGDNLVYNNWTGATSGYNMFGTGANGGLTFESIQVFAGGVPVIVNQTPVNITTSSATLRGNVVTNGGQDTAVTVYWGTSDPGPTAVGWAHTNTFATPQTGAVTTDITFGTPDVIYYYRFFASNATDVSWADVQTFLGGTVWLQGTQTNAAQAPLVSGTVTVVRASTATNEAIDVNLTFGGTATNGTGYQTIPTPVTIAKGAATATIVVRPLLTRATTDKIVIVTLSDGLYQTSTPSSVTVHIAPRASFPAPPPQFLANSLLIACNTGIVRYAISGTWSSWSATKLSDVVLGGDVNSPNGMAMSRDGRYLALANNGGHNVLRYRYDQVTGTAVPAGNPANGGSGAIFATNAGWYEVWYIVYGPDGNLYVSINDASGANGKVYKVTGSGVATLFATEPLGKRIAGLMFGPDLTGDEIPDLFVTQLTDNGSNGSRWIEAFDGVSGAMIVANYFTASGYPVGDLQFGPNVSTNAALNYIYVHEGNAPRRYDENGVLDGLWSPSSWAGGDAQNGFGPDLSGDGLPEMYFPRPSGGGGDIVVCRSVPTAAIPTVSGFTPTGAGAPRAVVWEIKASAPFGTMILIK